MNDIMGQGWRRSSDSLTASESSGVVDNSTTASSSGNAAAGDGGVSVEQGNGDGPVPTDALLATTEEPGVLRGDGDENNV